MSGKRVCCSCKKEAMLMPYVCPDCLGRITQTDLKDEVERLRGLLIQASRILQDNGFEEEGKAIDCMAEL